ncbi:hypothetical protein BGX28_000129 [Mortierella sp. GBA30]|nr:hypothetical protein BGX28_000129 [Mortierella sp. GBA30]
MVLIGLPPPRIPSQSSRNHVSLPLSIHLSLTISISLALISSFASAAPSTTPPAPNPVGGFAICQTTSSLHIQGGVSYAPSATYLITTNQHFRLDLSRPFDSSSTPTWANLTSDYSPFQRFHAGACSPDQASFLTVGNADESNPGNFMMAYSVSKGTWTGVSQAASAATTSSVGRTMAAFAIGSMGPTSVGAKASALGVVIGGGYLPQRSNIVSGPATSLNNLVTEADLISFGGDGSIGGLTWSVAPSTGNGSNNVATNLGPLAGAKVVILPGASGKAVVLGGVTKGLNGGMSFTNIPIVDLASGAVAIQKAQSSTNSIPAARYGHCVVLSSDGNTIFVFGGALASSDKVTNDLYGLDIRTWTWFQPTIKISSISPPPVRDHQCVMVGDQLLSFLGFNTNQAPASSTQLSPAPGSTSAIPTAPPIYVLSTTQWTWSNQYIPLPGTPSPPPIPNVPTDGSNGKINGVGIAFGIIFGLAFVGVIGYMVFAHKRKQRRKAETLVLVELERQKKEDADLEKKRQQQQEEAPLPPIPPMAHAHNANYHSQSDSMNVYNDLGNAIYPPVGSISNPASPYYQAQNPFQDPNHHIQQQQFAHSPYYAEGHDKNPFDQSNNQFYPPPPPVIPQQHNAAEPPTFVPEEMGYASPTLGHGIPTSFGQQGTIAVPNSMTIGGPTAGARDKTSFIEASSSYR